MTGQSAIVNRSDNLYEPVDIDPGAHGRFVRRELDSAPAADPSSVKLGIAAALSAAIVGAVAETWTIERLRHR